VNRAALIRALFLGVVAAGLALLSRIVVLPWFESASGWVIPTDLWVPLRAARSVANLDVFHLYEPLAGRTGYPYTPGLPIVLAPVAAVGDHFHLLGDVLYPQRRPGMFLLLGPAEAFVGIVPVVFVAGRAVAKTRAAQAQVLVFVVAVFAAVIWFHPEDTVAIAFVLAAALATQGDDDWRRVGALCAVAVLFKQWAMWPALPLIMAAPRPKRSLTAFYAFGIPALVMLPFLLVSRATWMSLTETRASLAFGQPQLWMTTLFGHREFADADWLRYLWGASAVAVAWRARTRRDVDSLIAAVGVIMLARLLVEPTLFGYYLVPAVIPAVLWCIRNNRPVVLRTITTAFLCAFCLPHTYPQPVFFAMLVFGMGYVCGPMLRSLVSVTSTDRPPEPAPVPAVR
jgi:hypothetical protein